MNFLSSIVLFRLKFLTSVCSAISLGSKVHITALSGNPVGAGVRPRSWRPEQPGPGPGNVGVRAGAGRGARGGPGTPDSTDASSPETGADGLPVWARPPRRPGPSDIAAHDRVILSDEDLAAIARAVARAREDGKNDRQDAAAGLPGPGPCPGPPAEAPRCSAPPPAMTQARRAAGPAPPWGTVLANTIRLWAARRLWPATMRGRVTSALILAAVLFCGGAVTVALARGTIAAKGTANGGQ